MLGNSRGASRFGCLGMLLLMGAAVYLAVQIVPVYMDKISLEDDLTRIVNKAGAESWQDKPIRDQILRASAGLNFDLAPSDIEIERVGRFQSASRLRVTVKFSREVVFPGYSHLFAFQSEFESLVGRL